MAKNHDKYKQYTREELIDELETLKKKKYGLVWDKKNSQEMLDVFVNWENIPENFKPKQFPVLKEVKNKGIETDKNKPVNLLIEGDNYHSLAVLNFTHQNKIDVIYIDPPYNTGNKDFIYNDKFIDKEDPFRHSKWLSFMEKRLVLAQKLLKKTGVIFISIDDNEQAQLKLLCDEVFGENNFIGEFVWKNKLGGGNDSKILVTEHEYILCYSKNINTTKRFTKPNIDNGKYLYQDKYFKTRGKFALEALYRSSIQYSDSLFYSIKSPDGTLIWPNESDRNSKKHIWRWSQSTFERKSKEGRVEFKKTKNGWRVFSKQYFLEDDDGNLRVLSARSIIDFIGNRQGTELLKKIFDDEKIFNNPKPIELIRYLLEIYQNKQSVILDFFAGSGTTAQSVLSLNKKDKGNRKFILCTNDKELDNNGNSKKHKICTNVCYPRIEKVINGYKNSKGVKVAGLGGNLKYFKTDFVSSDSTDKNRRDLINKSAEMICIKEDIFDLVVDEGFDFKIYQKGKKFLGVIFELDAIADFKKEAEKHKGNFVVYCFSYTEATPEKEFKGLKNKYVLKPIPAIILRIYLEIFKK